MEAPDHDVADLSEQRAGASRIGEAEVSRSQVEADPDSHPRRSVVQNRSRSLGVCDMGLCRVSIAEVDGESRRQRLDGDAGRMRAQVVRFDPFLSRSHHPLGHRPVIAADSEDGSLEAARAAADG